MSIDPRNIELVDPIMLPILRSQSGAAKVESSLRTFAMVRNLATHAVKAQHPHWCDDEVRAEIVRRLRGERI